MKKGQRSFNYWDDTAAPNQNAECCLNFWYPNSLNFHPNASHDFSEKFTSSSPRNHLQESHDADFFIYVKSSSYQFIYAKTLFRLTFIPPFIFHHFSIHFHMYFQRHLLLSLCIYFRYCSDFIFEVFYVWKIIFIFYCLTWWIID